MTQHCYHGMRHWKTETVVRKFREASSRQRPKLAWELSFRDPDLARAVVGEIAQRSRRTKNMVLCLHYVADPRSVLELAATGELIPDALHLSAFAALLQAYRRELPHLDSASAPRRLGKLGFLGPDNPNPLTDGPADSEAERTSPERYAEMLTEFLSEMITRPELEAVRPLLAHHLRTLYEPEGYEALLRAYARGQLDPLSAFAAVHRIGPEASARCLGRGGLEGLAEALIEQLRLPPAPHEAEILDSAELAVSLAALPIALRLQVGAVVLDTERLARQHDAVGQVVTNTPGFDGARIVLQRAPACSAEVVAAAAMKSGPEGARVLLAEADRHPIETIVNAARALSYAEAATLLGDAACGDEPHRALFFHPDAPPDRLLVERARAWLDSEPDKALRVLRLPLEHGTHPGRDEAFAEMLRLARAAALPLRKQAIHELGTLGDPVATPALLEALADPRLRDSLPLVLSAIRRCADARAVEPLQQLAGSESRYASWAASALEAIRERLGGG